MNTSKKSDFFISTLFKRKKMLIFGKLFIYLTENLFKNLKMMKKFTLFFTMLLLLNSYSKAQVLFDVPFTDGVMPATWQTIDQDGFPGDPFFVGQGLWAVSNWEFVNFGPPFDVALYAVAEFDTASTPGVADDWLISDGYAALNAELVFDINFLANGMTLDLMVTTTIAGATPVPSDFTAVEATYTTGTAQAWDTKTVDLSSYSGSTIYIAWRFNTNDPTAGNDVKIVALRNLELSNLLTNDVEATSMSLNTAENYTTDYLVTNLDYSVYSCQGSANETVDITFTNNGAADITQFTACYIVDSLTTGGTPFCETITLGSPLASGASYTHSFTSTADFLTAGDPLYGVDGWVTVPGDGDPGNDTTFIPFVITPQPIDVASGGYIDNFDQADFTAGQFQNFETSWGWTYEDANGDGFPMIITTPAAANSGDFALEYFWNDNGTTGADDWAFSPCLTLEAGKTYLLTFQAQVGEDGGGVYDEKLEVGIGTSASSGAMTIAQDFGTLSNSTYQQFSACITVPANGTYNLGFHCYSDADKWFLNIDDVSLAEASGTPTAAFSVLQTDETSPLVEYCDGDVTFSDASTGAIAWSWDFNGDGTEDATGPGPHPYNFATNGTYDAELTVTNCAGSNSTTQSIQVTDVPAPTVTVTSSNIDNTTGLAIIGLDITPNCGNESTFVSWGDGTTDSQMSHTYTSEGSYDVTITVTNSAGSDQATLTFNYFTNINEINFLGNLNMFPNPTNNMLNVNFELAETQDVELSIVSIDGKTLETRILSTSNVNETFDVSSVANGLYILKVKADDAVSTRKFTVQK